MQANSSPTSTGAGGSGGGGGGGQERSNVSMFDAAAALLPMYPNSKQALLEEVARVLAEGRAAARGLPRNSSSSSDGAGGGGDGGVLLGVAEGGVAKHVTASLVGKGGPRFRGSGGSGDAARVQQQAQRLQGLRAIADAMSEQQQGHQQCSPHLQQQAQEQQQVRQRMQVDGDVDIGEQQQTDGINSTGEGPAQVLQHTPVLPVYGQLLGADTRDLLAGQLRGQVAVAHPDWLALLSAAATTAAAATATVAANDDGGRNATVQGAMEAAEYLREQPGAATTFAADAAASAGAAAASAATAFGTLSPSVSTAAAAAAAIAAPAPAPAAATAAAVITATAPTIALPTPPSPAGLSAAAAAAPPPAAAPLVDISALRRAVEADDLTSFLRAARCSELLEALTAPGREYDAFSLTLCAPEEVERMRLPAGPSKKLQYALRMYQQAHPMS